MSEDANFGVSYLKLIGVGIYDIDLEKFNVGATTVAQDAGIILRDNSDYPESQNNDLSFSIDHLWVIDKEYGFLDYKSERVSENWIDIESVWRLVIPKPTDTYETLQNQITPEESWGHIIPVTDINVLLKELCTNFSEKYGIELDLECSTITDTDIYMY